MRDRCLVGEDLPAVNGIVDVVQAAIQGAQEGLPFGAGDAGHLGCHWRVDQGRVGSRSLAILGLHSVLFRRRGLRLGSRSKRHEVQILA